MAKKKAAQAPTLTEMLRQALENAESIREVSRETGLHHASLLRFMRGERSLVLERADALIRYFGIQCIPKSE